RPLAHRRIKTFAMRDVAGMIRSFSYAGYAALFGLVPGVSTTEQTRNQIEGWAAYWGAWVSAEYLKAYFETASGAPFVGSDPKEHRLLFDAFMLQKALYEVSYELNNRPDWVQIPLRGILSLIA
ncbi:MAG: treS, partial [Bryobacterales bacterium]|nr:treS [Bryobacterales bacterium]